MNEIVKGRKTEMPPRKQLTQGRQRASPPAKRMAQNVQPIINRLAYEVDRRFANALKTSLLTGRHAETVKIITAGEETGLLMSFRNWEQIVSFFEYTSLTPATRHLVPSLRLSCGNTDIESTTRDQALQIMRQKAADQAVTEQEANQDSGSEDENDDAEQNVHFQQYLARGVYCDHCSKTHQSMVPTT